MSEPRLLESIWANLIAEMPPETLREHRREVVTMVEQGDDCAAGKAIVGGIVAAIRAQHAD